MLARHNGHTKRKATMSNLELNQGDSFIFLIDVSGSMAVNDTPTGQSRYDFAKEKAIAFCKVADQYDTNGISIYRFGHAVTQFKDITSDKIDDVFKAGPNEMSTDTAGAIRAAYAEHKAAKNEQTFVIVVTDGTPNDANALKRVIVEITQDVKDEKEFRITFLQVGKDAAAAAFLASLDDDLKGAKYDIVDTKRLEEVDFMGAVAGALND